MNIKYGPKIILLIIEKSNLMAVFTSVNNSFTNKGHVYPLCHA